MFQKTITQHESTGNESALDQGTPQPLSGSQTIMQDHSSCAAGSSTSFNQTSHTLTDAVAVSSTERTASANTLCIHASRRIGPSCGDWCSCVCHKTHRLTSPSFMNLFLGSLFIGYSGLPMNQQLCNERLCRGKRVAMVKVTYHFPRWALARTLHAMINVSSMGEPKLLLRLPRVIHWGSDIFKFAKRGNINGIKTLFSQGLASPFDVDDDDGETALHASTSSLNSMIMMLTFASMPLLATVLPI